MAPQKKMIICDLSVCMHRLEVEVEEKINYVFIVSSSWNEACMIYLQFWNFGGKEGNFEIEKI